MGSVGLLRDKCVSPLHEEIIMRVRLCDDAPDSCHCVWLAGRGEDAFERMLAEREFAVMRLPAEMLHEEYRGGEYRVLRVCKRG